MTMTTTNETQIVNLTWHRLAPTKYQLAYKVPYVSPNTVELQRREVLIDGEPRHMWEVQSQWYGWEYLYDLSAAIAHIARGLMTEFELSRKDAQHLSAVTQRWTKRYTVERRRNATRRAMNDVIGREPPVETTPAELSFTFER